MNDPVCDCTDACKLPAGTPQRVTECRGLERRVKLVEPLPRPEIADMLTFLDELRQRVAAGEFEAIWLLAWGADRTFVSVERGKPRDRLIKIGAIECFKHDLINTMDTGTPSGFS